MYVVKRNGKKEEVRFDKILQRVKAFISDLNVEPVSVSQKVVAGLHEGITTKAIDNLLAETASVLASEHPDYAKLAARIAVSSLHKETTTFYQTMKMLYKEGYLSDDFIQVVKQNGTVIESSIKYDRDFDFDYFGYKTLEKSYLLKINGKIVERPQHLFMRVAIGVCGADLDKVFELYDLMSQGYYTHATPTLFNAGTKRPQMSSCFLISMEDDSIDGIYNTLKECALISKHAGGIGLHVHNVRAQGSHIKGTNGTSNGIIPMLKVFNETARYVDQGGGKRKGSIAIYIEPWHADIETFLDLKKNTGKEEFRARDLFLALWVPDLFMKRVEADQDWSLMCPNECPDLSDSVGDAFEKLYTKYEKEGKVRKTIKAREIMMKIMESLSETGVPYILFKDAANLKSNQQNIGVIKSSNLCTEILEVSTPEETAVCNLASICLPKFIIEKKGKKYFDFDKLIEVVKVSTRNLNFVIDKNFYPTEKTKRSNMRHRPIGIGVQGLADVFYALGYAYDSQEAKDLNKEIFEAMYFGACTSSMELAKENGAYETFQGSPASQGKLQFDLWGVAPSDKYDWSSLKEEIKKHGMRNSLLIAPMPTASTSQIFGNTEAFEPVTSNIYKRQTLAGEFIVVNKYLVRDLQKLNLWNGVIRDKIISENGSVQNIPEIPSNVKEVYKTVWEMSQKVIIDLAADRGPFICQSQSMNLYFAKPNFGAMNSALFYGWKKGLKTGSYYTRSRPAVDAVKVTTKIEEKVQQSEALVCSLENPESCEACGS
jgi:ribonucleoside-diphosphate reductase alpha chain